MLLDHEQSQLVLVDYQIRLMPAIFESEFVLKNAERLGQVAKLLGIPVWGTEQNPEKLGGNSDAIRALCGETLSKMHFSAMADGLGDWLRPEKPAPVPPPNRQQMERQQGGNSRSMPKYLQNRQQPPEPAELEGNLIVIGGCEAHVCLLQTALDLLEDEYDVWVVTDACSSRTERNRDAAFDRLATAGAELVTTEMVVFEWLRTAEHPSFRSILPLIK
jgi:nicotinamidase-related amidase